MYVSIEQGLLRHNAGSDEQYTSAPRTPVCMCHVSPRGLRYAEDARGVLGLLGFTSMPYTTVHRSAPPHVEVHHGRLYSRWWLAFKRDTPTFTVIPRTALYTCILK